MTVVASCLGLVTTAALGLWTVERSQLREMDRERAQTAAALDQAKAQIQDLTQRLNTLAALAQKSAEAPAQPAPAATATSAPRTVSPPRQKRYTRPAPADPRLNQLEGQLADTKKELASTREELAKNKEELDGKINSTRDDLTSSIAKTHDDVVLLQKRGEQNIYEFNLGKSKEMQRVGPLSFSLRSTNVKHKTYDLAMMVDDNALNKKHINLYEPVWITLSDRSRPVQLVVNHIEKNKIEGYVSEPKYKKSELSANTGQPAGTSDQKLATRDRAPVNQ